MKNILVILKIVKNHGQGEFFSKHNYLLTLMILKFYLTLYYIKINNYNI